MRQASNSNDMLNEHDVSFPEAVYTVHLKDNEEYNTNKVRLMFSSMVTPGQVLEYNMEDRSREVLKTQPVPGYDATQYVTERVESISRYCTYNGVALVVSYVSLSVQRATPSTRAAVPSTCASMLRRSWSAIMLQAVCCCAAVTTLCSDDAFLTEL